MTFGHYVGVEHKINLTDEIPFKHRHRRIPPGMFEEVRDHLKQLAAAGIIRRSHSPWSSGVVLARKKDGKLRMCVDYRALNSRTIKDSYALPRIDEVLDALAGAKYYSLLDMKSGVLPGGRGVKSTRREPHLVWVLSGSGSITVYRLVCQTLPQPINA